MGWGGSIFLGESQSRIYPHMRAKFGRGPTVVSKRGAEYRHTNYETFTSMSGTIGLYRENAIAIESEAKYPFGGNV